MLKSCYYKIFCQSTRFISDLEQTAGLMRRGSWSGRWPCVHCCSARPSAEHGGSHLRYKPINPPGGTVDCWEEEKTNREMSMLIQTNVITFTFFFFLLNSCGLPVPCLTAFRLTKETNNNVFVCVKNFIVFEKVCPPPSSSLSQQNQKMNRQKRGSEEKQSVRTVDYGGRKRFYCSFTAGDTHASPVPSKLRL